MKGVFAFSFALMHSATVLRRIKQSRKTPSTPRVFQASAPAKAFLR